MKEDFLIEKYASKKDIAIGNLRTIETANYLLIVDCFRQNKDGSIEKITFNHLPIELKEEFIKSVKG